MAELVCYDSLDLIFVQPLEQSLMNRESGTLLGPAEHKRIRSRVRGDCQSRHGNTRCRGHLGNLGLQPAVLSWREVMESTRSPNDDRTDQILQQNYEERSHKPEDEA